MTEWRTIPGYSRYAISKLGEVRNDKGKLLRGSVRKDGYRTMTLVKDAGGKVEILHHRIVAMAWLPPDPDRPHVNHKDFDRLNNAAGNLEWCTQKENIRHATRHGKMNTARGERAARAKHSNDSISFMRWLYRQGVSVESLTDIFQYHPAHTKRLVRGQHFMQPAPEDAAAAPNIGELM